MKMAGKGHCAIATLMISILAAIPLTGAVRVQAAEADCGPLTAYASVTSWPRDYREGGSTVSMVDTFHFTPLVESLTKPMFQAGFGGDFGYTLRMIPNHHRALLALIRLGERMHWAIPKGLEFSYECYYDRAMRFRPDDMVVRMIYARFLQKRGRDKEASSQLEFVASKRVDDPVTNYSLGMLYLDMKDYDKAVEHARRAYAAGNQNPALKDLLQQLGKWPEAGEAAPPDSVGSGSAPAPAPALPPESAVVQPVPMIE